MRTMPHVLVVEDDPLVAEVIAAALEDDYTTSLVETSAAALQHLGRGGIDLMLLDCTLPDGVDPSLVPGDPQRIDGLVTQPRPFILKPFTLADLVNTVTQALRGARPAAA
jgi:DNA-binding response OmpR family regulator